MAIDFSQITEAVNFDAVAASLMLVFIALASVYIAYEGGRMIVAAITGDWSGFDSDHGSHPDDAYADWKQHPDTGKWFDSENIDHYDKDFNGFDNPTYKN